MIPFSVIMPVYNEIKNIHEVLQALYQQTLVPNEIIVVDG
ncbi:glycosyltransferase [bacterium]|nr:glycosyltransferase [bacterium]